MFLELDTGLNLNGAAACFGVKPDAARLAEVALDW